MSDCKSDILQLVDKKRSDIVWRSALEDVGKLTDRLGMPVDKEIAETVAIMRLMGVRTTMSCAGHLERITGGPYVMFISPEADILRVKAVAVNDPASAECKKLYHEALRLNLLEQQKVYRQLEKFYESRKVAYGQMIMIRTMGYSGNRLYCQGAELAHIRDEKVRKDILSDNRNEMRTFTEYLKDEYFAKNL